MQMVNEKEWGGIKRGLSLLPIRGIAKITERSYFTVFYVKKSHSFKHYQKLIKECGISRARNLVERLEEGDNK